MEDWRLNSQEKYLTNAVLYRVKFPDFWPKAYADKNQFYQTVLRQALNHVQLFPEVKESTDGENVQLFWHEHCDFCWEKAMTNIDCEFYCTMDMQYWICKECFCDFNDKFGWKEKTSDQLFEYKAD